MPSSFAFGCYLVGSNSRLVECARLVLSKGHRIHGILSSDPTVSQWADENQIRCDDLAETSVLTHKPFDYLCSIDNPLILPDSVLRLPREMAVNFHDAPLPHYAGVNAVSWAILNRESTHGVTWHVMTARVDAGDILKQSIVPLSEAETALTLNAKCFDASLTSFAELLDEIDGGRVERRPQPTSGRTFFPRFQRPPLGGVLDFGTPAEDLDALVRALDFGPYPNPLGVPKLFLGNRALAIGSLRMGGGSQANPGTVQRLSDETIQVATPTRDVVIGALTTLRGEDVQLRDMVPVTTGERMPRLDPASTANSKPSTATRQRKRGSGNGA